MDLWTLLLALLGDETVTDPVDDPDAGIADRNKLPTGG